MARFIRHTVFWVSLIFSLSSCNFETFDSNSETSRNARITVQWDPPVERENEEQLFLYEIGGYELSFRAVGDTQYQTVVVQDGETTEFDLSLPKSGKYEIRIAAFDTNGLYSRYSDAAILDAQ